VLFETASRYHAAQKWYVKILLLMPDHLHMLVGIPGDADLSNLVRDFKRITAKNREDPAAEFSITDYGTIKARQKNLNTSARTLYGQV